MTDRLFSPDYDQPVDTRTQVDRMPGTPDAACLCVQLDALHERGALSEYWEAHRQRNTHPCLWPFCGWKDHHNDEEAA